jgi:hypothetical protein
MNDCVTSMCYDVVNDFKLLQMPVKLFSLSD